MNDLQRFLSKTRTEGKCLLRTSPTGAFSLNGKSYNPRTAAWILYKGKPPSGRLTTTCGTKGCVCIAHLEDKVNERGMRNRSLHYKSGDHNNKMLLVPIKVALEGGGQKSSKLPALYSRCCRECGSPLYFTMCVVSFCPRSWVRRNHGDEKAALPQNPLL
jgi:hypothetical protein